jgi:hypothetical protein
MHVTGYLARWTLPAIRRASSLVSSLAANLWIGVEPRA